MIVELLGNRVWIILKRNLSLSTRENLAALTMLLLLIALHAFCLIAVNAKVGSLTSVNINFGGSNIGDRFVSENLSDLWGETIAFEKEAAVIGGAEDKNRDALKSHRYGSVPDGAWGYNINGLRPGVWECSLHWAEISSDDLGVGKRVFGVSVAGESREIDVYSKVFGFTSYTETFTGINVDVVNHDHIDIVLTSISGKGNPFLSAVTCEVKSCVDVNGNAESCFGTAADNFRSEVSYDIGGTGDGAQILSDESIPIWGSPPTSSTGAIISNADLVYENAYKTHRYGAHWGLSIPNLSSGTYSCTVMFAETFTGNFEPGKRVFNMIVEGQIRTGIDVFASVGGYTAFTESFHNIWVSEHNGNKIDMVFSAVHGEAFLSAVHCARWS